jgi:hypothetical protein
MAITIAIERVARQILVNHLQKRIEFRARTIVRHPLLLRLRYSHRFLLPQAVKLIGAEGLSERRGCWVEHAVTNKWDNN